MTFAEKWMELEKIIILSKMTQKDNCQVLSLLQTLNFKLHKHTCTHAYTQTHARAHTYIHTHTSRQRGWKGDQERGGRDLKVENKQDSDGVHDSRGGIQWWAQGLGRPA